MGTSRNRKNTRAPLPFPGYWVSPKDCRSCHYDLTGLEMPANCPECGTPHDVIPMILCGTPKLIEGGTPGWRKALWALVFIGGFGLTQCWGLLLFSGNGAWMIVCAVALAALTVFLLATGGKRERRGVERLLFVEGGFWRTGINRRDSEDDDVQFISWGDTVRAEVKSVGDYWAILKVRGMASHKRLLEMGIRCPRAEAGIVAQTIEVLGAMEPTDALCEGAGERGLT